jgi:hypothetical protein
MSENFDDDEYEPETEELPAELHSDFVVHITLSHSFAANMSPATSERCADKLCDMSLALKRIIDNWEKSGGQGEGGRNVGGREQQEEEDHDDGASVSEEPAVLEFEFGSLQNRPRCALDFRSSSFIAYNQSHLLSLWHMLERHGFLL